MKQKLTYEQRYEICKKCPHFIKFWKTCKLCGCFMPLKTKIRWVECPDEPARWTQEMLNGANSKAKKITESSSTSNLKKDEEKEEKW